ncbi:MAG TPA: hypothetical protein VG099_29845 [Gemmataceae bacterium]|nr:hypothetical protein [Gemmataceae bacterium]
MTRNPFDQAARYVGKLDPPGFLGWLVPTLTAPLAFDGWLDTRTIPFPGDPDRTCDTVAAITDATTPANWWVIPIEFQTRPDPELFGRLLEYLGRLWLELRPPSLPQGRFAVAAAVINLTGAGQTSREMLLGATGLRTCLTVAERNLREEDAAQTLARIADGRVVRCLLPFIPLMHYGGEARKIERWKQLAQAEPDARRRADYAGLALVFADLTDCRPVWKQALEGWNVEQSAQVLEWETAAAKRTKVEDLLRVLGKRFPPAAPADLEQAIRDTGDLEQLDRLLDAAATAATLAAFRRRAGLAAHNGGGRQTSKTKRTAGRRKS